MQRTLIATSLSGLAMFAGCAKKSASKDSVSAAEPTPTSTATGGAVGSSPMPEPTTVAPDTTVTAKEAARTSGHLGPTTDQAQFGPLEGDRGTKGGHQDTNKVGGSPTKPTGGGPGQGGARTYLATLEAPTLEGGADAAPVRDALTKRSTEVQVCYDKAREAKPELVGTLRIVFTVKADGSLTAVSVDKSALKNAGLERCVIGIVKSTKLAKPIGTAAVKGTLSISFAKG
jgi:outer membrane biosynthesis protein TonB